MIGILMYCCRYINDKGEFDISKNMVRSFFNYLDINQLLIILTNGKSIYIGVVQ